MESPAWAGLVSYAGGLITMIVAVIALRERVPSWKAVVDVPWYAWSGGMFGGAFILLAILLLPSLGAATLFALVIAGQVLAAVTLDHFGAFGLTPHPESETSTSRKFESFSSTRAWTFTVPPWGVNLTAL